MTFIRLLGESELTISHRRPDVQKDAPSPFEDLVEMQCLWFIQEEGDAYAAKEDWGRALRRYHQILDVSRLTRHLAASNLCSLR